MRTEAERCLKMSRFAILVWLLAVSCMDSRATEPNQILNVSVGQSVTLPCPCSEDTNKLVWQIGEEIVVNHCCTDDHPLHESYVYRTQLFLFNTKGNCSLLLRNVSLTDEKRFTCYVFEGKDNFQHRYEVELKVKDAVLTTNYAVPQNYLPTSKPHTGFKVGVPLLLILVILTILIVALLIRRQRRPRMVVIQDPQAKLLDHTPV
ncbi:hypothetical protein Q7C36_008903 [Tachysurus vachellii]|uniref:Ig-like domain-containing protein n=1 Tax=Tachysurus vachellii TaxID=175792 RepID=A0AA88N2H4_TACVA|nr:uncharacterized protein si:dkey-192g7.3 [Tachysurus vachellii]KAK2850120.1 hypothetical protein Q7C36_008903 [Tachysurus vachellii]